MKLVTCFLLAWLAPGAQQQPSNQAPAPPETKPEDLCTVEGQVASMATGAPIRKAEVTLRGQRAAPGMLPGNYIATSDAGGHFTIKDVEPGKYRLSVQRTGFVTLVYGARGPNRDGATLSLSPGQRLKDLALKLSPQAVITGRIVDENDDPVVSASVRTMRSRYLMGKKQLVPAGGAETNDLGEYRISGLAPGRYFLIASEDRQNWQATVDASATRAQEGYVTTYYPGTSDPASAVPIEVGAGAQMRGVNLRLAKGRTFRVRGRVEGRPDANVFFYPRGEARTIASDELQRVTDGKGNFEIDGVLAGGYTVAAVAWSSPKALCARQELDVGEHDIDNLVLALAPGAELSGRIDVDSGTMPDLGSANVFLQPQEGRMVMRGMSSRVQDGAFSVADLAPDVYHLQIGGLPDGYWVKSVRMGDQEVKIKGIDLTRGPGDALTVIIAPNAAQIDGAVIDEKQQPAAGATVVLVPEPRLRDFFNAYKITTSDEHGRFSLKNVEPGEYKLFAWQDIEYGAYMDPDFLRPLEDRGHSISIQEGGREAVQLTVIPADSAPAAPKER